MATNSPGSTARYYHHDLVFKIKQTLFGADGAKTTALPPLTKGSIIQHLISGVYIHTSFNGTATLDVGTAGTPTLYMSALAITGAVGFVVMNGTAAATGGFRVDVNTDQPIFARVNGTPTTGEVTVVISGLT